MQPYHPIVSRLVAATALAALTACGDKNSIDQVSTPVSQQVTCDATNGGITLPPGFCAVVFADLVVGGKPAAARHLAITPAGDLFVAINNPSQANPAFGIVALRDTNGDGRADMQSQFSPNLGGSGITWANNALYFGANDRVMRYSLPNGQLTPASNPDVVVSGLPATGDHVSKTLVFGNASTLYVNIGSATNSCQTANRQLQSPGQNPCPELPIRAGVWAFNPAGTNQTEADGHHYATGYRNLVALDINPANGQLYGVQQGRDMLSDNWPQFFNDEQSANLPNEEFVRITDGSNNGWPYCYYDDQTHHAKMLGPEYGGNGTLTSGNGFDCATYNQPLATFGAHWSPDGMHFYKGVQFPARYRGGMFVVFHGGFNRAPLPNEGYKVLFVPMGSDGRPSGPAETFADGFAGPSSNLPADAVHRPVGVAEGPDGSLYFSDDKAGRIWRVVYRP